MHPALAKLPAWADPWPGKAIIDGLPESEYHGTKALVSKSALDEFARSPQHYLYSLDAPKDERTEAMDLGSAFHVLTLEPDLFGDKVAIIPDSIDSRPMQSSTNRALRDRWIEEEGNGRIILRPRQFKLINDMAKAVRHHPAAKSLLAVGDSEVTALWTCPETGIRCKSRADFFGRGRMGGVFADLKSSVSAAPDTFARTAAAHRYHVQDAFYSRAFEENDEHIDHFVFIVVESAPPHVVAVYQLDETAKLKGEQLYMRELRRLRECIERDYFPGYGDEVMNLTLPPWTTRDEET